MGQKQIREGSTVSWDWGNGKAEGKVQSIFRKKVTRTIDGNEVTKKANGDNPAYYIEQDDGSNALKLRSELDQG